jgi:hypothetical protein
VARGLEITGFEVVQAVFAFAIWLGGAVGLTRSVPGAAMSLAVLCLLGGAACYSVAFTLLGHDERRRTFYVYGTFGIAQLLVGTSLLLSGTALALAWSVLAVAAMWTGIGAGRVSMRVHAAVYLLFGASASGLLAYAFAAMSWGPAAAPGLAILVTACAAAACYAEAPSEEDKGARIPAFIVAGIVCWSILGLSAAALIPLANGGSGSAPVRTALICALALALPSASRRWRRPELAWLLYPVMLGGAAKLALVDFAQGRPAVLAVSLLLYGATLMLLPRVMRASRQASAPVTEAAHAAAAN